jgi:subtilisin family serine protease
MLKYPIIPQRTICAIPHKLLATSWLPKCKHALAVLFASCLLTYPMVTVAEVSLTERQDANPLNILNIENIFYPHLAFVDIDKDGDWDVFIGENEGTIHYYKNGGTATAPDFVDAANPFHNVDVGLRSTPAFVDIDNDGDKDAFIGESEGHIKYYENISGTFRERDASNPLSTVNAEDVKFNNSVPTFIDIDNDQDQDAFIGSNDGTVKYYENVSTPESLAFEKQNDANPFNEVEINLLDSVPTFVDIDKDGDWDVFIGEHLGNIRYYENTGDAQIPSFEERTGTDNPFDGIDVGDNSTLAWVDIDGDGDSDVFIGEKDGIRYFQNNFFNEVNEVVKGEFIIKFKGLIGTDSAVQEKMREIQKINGAEGLRNFPTIGAQLWKFSDEEMDESRLRSLSRLRSNPNIEYVEPNYLIKIDQTPNDSLYPKQWGPEKIRIEKALEIYHQLPEKGDIIVAVIDTGVDYTHPDLASKMWKDPDDFYGYDFFNEDNDPIDDHYHGTHCAGIIAAVRNNEIGIVGIADFVKIMALKIQDKQGIGNVAAAISAIEYATQSGAKIINASWGILKGTISVNDVKALKDAFQKAQDEGILVIAAAGNHSRNNDENPHYPASYKALDNIISVAATNRNDELATFSHYGRNSVDLAAPGVDIYSTVHTDEEFDCNEQGCYMNDSGTSMAVPHVTGVAALLWSARPEITYLEVKNKLLSSVDKIPALEEKTVTGGRLNAFKALLPDEELVAICTISVNGLRATLEAVKLDNVDYNWTIDKGENTTEQSGPKITVDFENAGVYPVTLVVTDNQGLTAQTQCQVEIPKSNIPPIRQVTAHIKASTTKGTAPLT